MQQQYKNRQNVWWNRKFLSMLVSSVTVIVVCLFICIVRVTFKWLAKEVRDCIGSLYVQPIRWKNENKSWFFYLRFPAFSFSWLFSRLAFLLNDLGDNSDFVLTKPNRNPLRANKFLNIFLTICWLLHLCWYLLKELIIFKILFYCWRVACF